MQDRMQRKADLPIAECIIPMGAIGRPIGRKAAKEEASSSIHDRSVAPFRPSRKTIARDTISAKFQERLRRREAPIPFMTITYIRGTSTIVKSS